MIDTTRQIAALVVLVAALTIGAQIGAQSSTARESDASIGEVNFAGDTAVLQLKKQNMHPVVVVDLGDGKQYEFIVDTGASVNVIDSSIAESLGYEVIDEIPADIVSVPLARIGDVAITDAEFLTMDVLGFSGGRTHGVLGSGAFSDYLLTFDRGAGHIKLSHDSLSADEPGVLTYDPSNSQVEINIDVAGTSVAAHIDTGSMGEFTLPGEMMESLSVRKSQAATKARLVGGNRDIKHAQLKGSIQFADLEFENPNVAFMTPSPGAGNIGSGILADYIVSIDQKNHLIAFREPADGGLAASNNKPRRLGVRFKGMPGGKILTIASVNPGSLGELAGLAAGDVLLTLNDKPTDQYDMPELGALFGSRAPLKFDVERDGEAKIIEIQ